MAIFPHFICKCAHSLQTGFALLLLLIMGSTHARIGYFWHITDLHLDTVYSTEGDVSRSCWRLERQSQSLSTHTPGRFGDYLCDSPWSLIESAAKAMKSRQGDNVEFVLWTGDGLSHSAHPLSETKKLEILRNITELFGRTFSSQFVFPVIGHEDGSTNFRHLGELWRHWLPSEALHTFEKGGYYSIEQTKSRLRIIALNTNFMRHDPKYAQSHLAAVRQRAQTNGDGMEYQRNYYYHHAGSQLRQHHGHVQGGSGEWGGGAHGYGYSSHHRVATMDGGGGTAAGGRVSALSEYETQDTEKQWLWLEDVLSKSKNNKETVYIVGHIPPGSDERHLGFPQNGHTTFTESNNKRYLELVRKYSSIIQGQFFGHLHSDSFRIIYDEKGKPVSWIMISPSVTPRKMSIGSNNPAMRLYKFDTDSGQVLDYTQYYLDLQLANQQGEPNWVSEYNLTHYYGLNDISAITLHNFVDRFASSDGTWFNKYYRANTVRYGIDGCDAACMHNHYCAITRVDYKEFRQCLEKEQSALRSSAAATILLSPSRTISSTMTLAILMWCLLLGCSLSASNYHAHLLAISPRGHRQRCKMVHAKHTRREDFIYRSHCALLWAALCGGFVVALQFAQHTFRHCCSLLKQRIPLGQSQMVPQKDEMQLYDAIVSGMSSGDQNHHHHHHHHYHHHYSQACVCQQQEQQQQQQQQQPHLSHHNDCGNTDNNSLRHHLMVREICVKSHQRTQPAIISPPSIETTSIFRRSVSYINVALQPPPHPRLLPSLLPRWSFGWSSCTKRPSCCGPQLQQQLQQEQHQQQPQQALKEPTPAGQQQQEQH